MDGVRFEPIKIVCIRLPDASFFPFFELDDTLALKKILAGGGGLVFLM